MEPSPELRLATDTFLDRLHRVSTAQFDLATPCEGWDVADLVNHVAVGSAMAVALLAGASTDEAKSIIDSRVEGDLLAECRHQLSAAVAAFEGAVDSDQIVHHPVGDVPAAQLLSFRIGDLTLHSWDLSRATGMDESLPMSLVERAWADFAPMEPFIGSIGLFGAGPSGSLDGTAGLQERLLDLSGRRP